MSNAALAIIAEHLSADDDPQLWEVAIRTLLAEAEDAAAEGAHRGVCRGRLLPSLDQPASSDPLDG